MNTILQDGKSIFPCHNNVIKRNRQLYKTIFFSVPVRNISIPGSDGRNSHPWVQRSVRPQRVSQGYHLKDDDPLRQGYRRLQQMHPQHRDAETEIFTQIHEEICLIERVVESHRVANFYVHFWKN